MRTGRWRAGWQHTEAGVSFRVVVGKKDVQSDGSTEDLRLEWKGNDGYWQPVTFAAAYILVDFFAENEDIRTKFQPHWQVQGGDYFMRSVDKARRVGWEQTNEEEVRAPRRKLEAVAQPTVARCAAMDDEGGRCQKSADHEGAHRSAGWVWPRRAA